MRFTEKVKTTTGKNNPKATTASVETKKSVGVTKQIVMDRAEEDTKNFARFDRRYERGGKPIPFGTFYIPLDEAEGLTHVVVTYTTKK
jgi:hypothetical protein